MAVRYGEESHLELKFDCEVETSTVPRPTLSALLYCYKFTKDLVKPATGAVAIAQSHNALVINQSGSFLVKSSLHDKVIVLPPNSLTVIRGGYPIAVEAARGAHQVQMVLWHSTMCPYLETWLNSKIGPRLNPPSQMATAPDSPKTKVQVEQLLDAMYSENDSADAIILGLIHQLTATICSSSGQFQLAGLPGDLPETMVELTEAVRVDPSKSWPLKEASDRAGYSPFHFSRIFKAIVGYGFHEFVDRCRTETAVDLLVNTDLQTDVIAGRCGFGTTQGLRESIKEYLGLVPSELRNHPELFLRI